MFAADSLHTICNVITDTELLVTANLQAIRQPVSALGGFAKPLLETRPSPWDTHRMLADSHDAILRGPLSFVRFPDYSARAS